MADDESALIVEFVQRAMDSRLSGLRVASPATVLSFNASKQTVSVQPSIKTRAPDGTLSSLPVISNVPVQYPRAGKGGMKFPLSAGDEVMLVFSDRSLDVWKSKGGTVDPQEGRKFNITDAVAYVGGSSPAHADGAFPAADLEISWGAAKVVLKESGAVEIQGTTFSFAGTTDDLVDLISQLAQQCSLITVGGVPTANAAAFALIKSKVDLLKE